MFRILIVDDQARIREGIGAILKNHFENIETDTASDGAEAFLLMQRKIPRLVITDIRMPDMDGIELMRKAKEEFSDTQFIVVSGYDDFSYAQKAIEYGARAYLLKPLDRDALLLAVGRLYDEYERKETARQGQNVRQETPGKEQEKPRFAERLLLYLKGGVSEKPFGEDLLNEYPLLKGNYRFILFGIPIRGLEEGRDALRQRLCRIAEKYTEGTDSLLLKDKNEMILISAPSLKDDTDLLVRARECSAGSIAVGEVFKGPDRLQEAYAQVKEIAVHHLLFPGNRYLTEQDISEMNTDFTIPYREVETICNLMGTGQDDEIKKYISGIFERKRLCSYRIGFAMALCDTLYRSLRATEEPLRNAGIASGADISMTNHLPEYCSMHAYLVKLQEEMLKLHHTAARYKEVYKENAKMEEAISYMKKNYAKELTLAMVSNEVSLNYAYFSNTFQKYTGKPFMIFLRDIRMEEGKKLLADTGLSIAEISERVGYDSYKSFSRSFKGVEGITPAEYRRKKNVLKGV